jgi:hypothetical protein
MLQASGRKLQSEVHEIVVSMYNMENVQQQRKELLLPVKKTRQNRLQ